MMAADAIPDPSARLLAAPLPPDGTIGVVAPSSPYHNRSDALRGIEWWEGCGYSVKLFGDVYARVGYLAGPGKRRAEALMEAFADPSVYAIHCLHGGFGATELISLLDFDVIRAHPKPFVGGSDVTVLHTAIRRFTGLVS